MQAYRICKARWATSAFSGIGAAEYPGRWNILGQKAIYCAESRSLGALEILVHVTRRKTLSRAKFVIFAVTIPDELICLVEKLPRGWNAKPNTEVSQKFGSRILRDQAAVMFPSVVMPGEYNFVLNPMHPRFSEIRWGKPEKLEFDIRLVGSSKR